MRRMLEPMGTRGFTLIEMVVAIAVAAVIGALISVFVTTPIQASVDVARRAELTDLADGAMRRLQRDLVRALPNSIRVTTVGTTTFVEYLEVRTGGRYRAEPSGAATDGNSCPDPIASGGDGDGQANEDMLSFGVTDSCFRSLGSVADLAGIVAGSDWLVVYNLGPGYPEADAYASGNASGGNKARVTATAVAGASENRISFESVAFNLASPGNRFQIVSGPVTYECNPAAGVLRRHAGYPVSTLQPTAFAGAPAVLAANVSACAIVYASGATERSGLVGITLALTAGGETVTVYHESHVSNVP